MLEEKSLIWRSHGRSLTPGLLYAVQLASTTRIRPMASRLVVTEFKWALLTGAELPHGHLYAHSHGGLYRIRLCEAVP